MRNQESPPGKIVFGGSDAFKVFRRGQLIVSLEWINEEPAMVVYAARRRPGAGAAVIGLSALPFYFDDRGMPARTPEIARKLHDILRVMGFEPNADRFALRDLLDALYAYADDLVRMPPEKPTPISDDLPVNVDAIEIQVDGKTVREITPSTVH